MTVQRFVIDNEQRKFKVINMYDLHSIETWEVALAVSVVIYNYDQFTAHEVDGTFAIYTLH